MGVLVPRTGFGEVTAGVSTGWQSDLAAFVRGELGFKPREDLDLFSFAQADLRGASAGVGARVTF